MLDLTKTIPFAVFGASLLGSTHCIAMCGGLALSRSQTAKDQCLYHLGRLSGYVSLGALAGEFGQRVFSPSMTAAMAWISSALMGFLFLALAIRTWSGKAPHFSIMPTAWFVRLGRKRGSYGTGLLTAALPCGWLQTFVLSAIATQSAWQGAAVLFAFWLGTLPALAGVPILTKRLLGPFALRTPRLAAILLLFAGLLSFGIRVVHLPGGLHSCGH